MRVVVVTVLLLIIGYSFFNHDVVEAYNPHNLHQVLPVTTDNYYNQHPPTTHLGKEWEI